VQYCIRFSAPCLVEIHLRAVRKVARRSRNGIEAQKEELVFWVGRFQELGNCEASHRSLDCMLPLVSNINPTETGTSLPENTPVLPLAGTGTSRGCGGSRNWELMAATIVIGLC
jgi:hypothetical protein